MPSNQNVENRQGNAAGRDVNVEAGPTNKVVAIHGGTNIIGNQGPVTVHTAPARRPRTVVHQHDPAIHITQEQQLALQGLRNEWVVLHNKLKKSQLDYGAALKRMNTAAGATACALIRKDRYEEVAAYVRKQMAILSNMKSAPRKDDEWRSKKIGAIKARCKNQFDGVDVYKPYIRRNFKLDSLADLATDQLQKTYAYIMAKKGPGV